MATNTVLARNLVSGQIAEVPESYLTHPHFSKQLERVEEGAKPFVPELHTPRDADGSELGDDAKPLDKQEAKAPTSRAPKGTTSDAEKR